MKKVQELKLTVINVKDDFISKVEEKLKQRKTVKEELKKKKESKQKELDKKAKTKKDEKASSGGVHLAASCVEPWLSHTGHCVVDL